MTTISDLIQQISFRLHSYTGIREQLTYLTAPIDTDDLLITVADGNNVTRGLIEIGEELVLVDRVEATTVQVYPFGRGAENTTAAIALTNAKVINDPILPRVAVFNAITETIHQIHPELFQVKTTEIAYNPAQITYELPADVDRILEVTADIPGVTGMWPQVNRWKFERSASTSEYATGKSLDLYVGMTSGYSFRVTYAAPYTTPTSPSDTLAALGIQESVKEVVELGTAWRLTQYLESARNQMQAVEQLARAEAVPPGAITNLAKQWYAMFEKRKAEERNRLLQLHPAQIHYTR